MSSLFSGVTNEPLLASLDRPNVSIVIIKSLIWEPLAELAEIPLVGEYYNLVLDAFFAEISSDD